MLHSGVLQTHRAIVAVEFLPVASPTMTHGLLSMCLFERERDSERETEREQDEEGLSESLRLAQLYSEPAAQNIMLQDFLCWEV